MIAAQDPQIFGFLLVPKFAMMAFTSAVEPLRAANLLSGKELYDWRVITRDGRPLPSSNRIRLLPDASIETVAETLNPENRGGPAGRLASVVVCGGMDGQLYQDQAVFAWLRRLARQGARVGALSDGSYILARAGLLDGYRCTIHWSCLPGFTETFPAIEASSEIYCIDRNRFTASGGTASLDLMLHMIEVDHGRELAIRLAGPPQTLLHGDYRLDNLFFGADGADSDLYVIDWQAVAVGNGLSDVAYFLVGSLDPPAAAAAGEGLLRTYHSTLVEHGVRDYGFDDCLRDFELARILVMLRAVVIFGLLDLSHERGVKLVDAAIDRMAQSVPEVDLDEVLR